MKTNWKNEFINIIVDEETDDKKDTFEPITEENNRHGKCIQKFCLEHDLPITHELLGIENDNYNGYLWCKALSLLGYLVIQEAAENTIIYIPPVVTKHQLDKMNQLKLIFKRRRECLYIYSYYLIENSLVEEKPNEFHELDSVSVLYDELKEKRKREYNVSRIKSFK